MGKRLNALTFAFARAGLPDDAALASLTDGQGCERGVGRPSDAAFAPLTVVREASVASSKKGKGRRSKERRVEFGGIRRDSG